MNDMMQGFDPSTFNPEQFKDLMSNMSNGMIENKDDNENNEEE